MSTTSRVAGAVAAGYALGRFKKLRLAVLVATAMSSPKLRAAAAGMLQDRIPGGAITSTLTKEVGGRLVNVGKTAATSIVASRIDTLSQSLADRSENLRKASPGGQTGKSRGEEPEDEHEEPEGEEAEEPEDEYEQQEGEEAEEPEDEYEEQEGEEAEEPEDEYEEQEGEEAEEPTDESEEQEGEEAEEPTDESEEQEASPDEQPEEPVARSPRRRRSASPAGRRRG
jgi:cobalamin biosynthesis protein CobT